jgi:drug/metabolite transporter (DMT)-like permease
MSRCSAPGSSVRKRIGWTGSQSFSLPDAKSWLGLLLLGVFQLGLSYIFYAAAIKHVSALEAILIPVLEPLLNPLWVFLLLGESPGWWAMIGGVIVLGAVTTRRVLMTKLQNVLSVASTARAGGE